MQTSAEENKGNEGADSRGDSAASDSGQGGGVLWAFPSGIDHWSAPGRVAGPPMGGSESHDWGAAYLEAGLSHQGGRSSNLSAQDKSLYSHDHSTTAHADDPDGV